MDSKLLEYFLRIAELGSINKAAADLHLSQPALSRHVASLEHEMGTKLFNRTQGGVHDGRRNAARRPRATAVAAVHHPERAGRRKGCGPDCDWHTHFLAARLHLAVRRAHGEAVPQRDAARLRGRQQCLAGLHVRGLAGPLHRALRYVAGFGLSTDGPPEGAVGAGRREGQRHAAGRARSSLDARRYQACPARTAQCVAAFRIL